VVRFNSRVPSRSSSALMRLLTEERELVNANYIVMGSEGTLGFVTEAKLRLTPIPKHKRLVVVKYAAFDDALRSALYAYHGRGVESG